MGISGRIASGLDATGPLSMAEDRRGILYMVNGVDTPLRWDGITAATENAGIVAPVTGMTAAGAGSGSVTGEYTCYVRYIDNDGIPSNFSPAVTATLTSNTGVAYGSIPVSSDTRVVNKELWRNTDGQTVTFYKDATITNATTSKTTTNDDEALIALTSLRFLTEDGFPNANRFTPPPTTMTVVEECFDRMWYLVPQGTTPSVDLINKAFFSEADEPYAVPTVNRIETSYDGDRLRGIMPLFSCAYFLKERHIYRLACTVDPRTSSQLSQVAERGVINNRCWSRVDGTAILMDRRGVYLFDGSTTQDISGPISDWFVGVRGGQTAPIDWTPSKALWYHMVNDPVERCVRIFVALVGDTGTRPKNALCFNYRLNQWFLETYPWEIGASANADVAGQPEVLVGSEESGTIPQVMLMNTGYTDDANGNTGDAIDWAIKLGSFAYLDDVRKNTREMRVTYNPTSVGTVAIKTFQNRSATADTLEVPHDEVNVSGAGAASGYTIDVTHELGEARIPMHSHGMEGNTAANRLLDVELSGSSSVKTEIYSLEIGGVGR